jgi:hypothetical protein
MTDCVLLFQQTTTQSQVKNSFMLGVLDGLTVVVLYNYPIQPEPMLQGGKTTAPENYQTSK